MIIAIIDTNIEKIETIIPVDAKQLIAFHTIANQMQILMKNSMVVTCIQQRNKRKTTQVRNNMKNKITTFKR